MNSLSFVKNWIQNLEVSIFKAFEFLSDTSVAQTHKKSY